MLIDSHAHIQGKEYAGETEAVIARAHAAGVEMIVAVGGAGDMSSNSEAVRLANSFANVYATVGMHPHDAKDVGADELAVLKQLAEDSKVVAIGETGLDYYYSHSPHDVQRRVFGQFIQMARQTKLPIVVHERDAAQEAVELLRSEGGGRAARRDSLLHGQLRSGMCLSRSWFLPLIHRHHHLQERRAAARSGAQSAAREHARRDRLTLSHSGSTPRKAQ